MFPIPGCILRLLLFTVSMKSTICTSGSNTKMDQGREGLLLDRLILPHCIPDDSAQLELQSCSFVGAPHPVHPATQTPSQAAPSRRTSSFQSNGAPGAAVNRTVEIVHLGSSHDDDDDDSENIKLPKIESRGNRCEQVQRVSNEDLQTLTSIGPVMGETEEEIDREVVGMVCDDTFIVDEQGVVMNKASYNVKMSDEDLDENDKSREVHSKGKSKCVDGGSTSVDEGSELLSSMMGGGGNNDEEAVRAAKNKHLLEVVSTFAVNINGGADDDFFGSALRKG